MEDGCSRRAPGHHYLSLAQNFKGRSAASAFCFKTAKEYLYALRACLCVDWLRHFDMLPPVTVDALLGQELLTSMPAQVQELLAKKRSGAVDQTFESKRLAEYIDTWLLAGRDTIDNLPARDRILTQDLDALLMKTIKEARNDSAS
jgi:predicted nucleotidyltransferase